eukprot:TRINITY_DN2954_c0_g1_i11.p1 TRINITY_DN2954_c0_g1~~TRINITY_DN2954_c0_g1_i11.p1  ORF type:complete len:391 (+),score=101.36 TRINITY_DN2954_c0_g1_i11:74-1246(+)
MCVFFFFFFKQKTAYEMLRSLVGSEMCIRDSINAEYGGQHPASMERVREMAAVFGAGVASGAVLWSLLGSAAAHAAPSGQEKDRMCQLQVLHQKMGQLLNVSPDAANSSPDAANSSALSSHGRSMSKSPSANVVGTSPHIHVVISYQSTQESFLLRLRDGLNSAGIDTADGTQVPAGAHWRNWYFGVLAKASIFLFVLSKESLESGACRDELFFARDTNKTIIPVLYDLAPIDQLAQDCTLDCLPAIMSVLNRCNRFPGSGRFDDEFDKNLLQLAGRVTSELASSGITPGEPFDFSAQYTPTDLVHLLWEGDQVARIQVMSIIQSKIAHDPAKRSELLAVHAFTALLHLSESPRVPQSMHDRAVQCMFALSHPTPEYISQVVEGRPLQTR